MKTIQPVQTWSNGRAVEATILNAYVVNDNLTTSATFYYALLSQDAQGYVNTNPLVSGNLTMTGQAYADWGTNPFAWDWIASELKLTITGDYIPPTTTTTTTTTEAPIV